MPIITFRWPSIKAWIAASPSRLASMRSLALGAPPYDFLYKAGVAAIFGPGTPVAKAACQILEILMDEE